MTLIIQVIFEIFTYTILILAIGRDKYLIIGTGFLKYSMKK